MEKCPDNLLMDYQVTDLLTYKLEWIKNVLTVSCFACIIRVHRKLLGIYTKTHIFPYESFVKYIFFISQFEWQFIFFSQYSVGIRSKLTPWSNLSV
jgi:hypothetical protein